MRIPKILCLTTLALLFLAMAQGWWHFIPMRSLKGAFFETEMSAPTPRSLYDGDWQRQTEKYARGHFGFHEAAIRLYDQLVWSCFRRSMNKGVIAGKDGWLYERYFVEDYYESRMYKYTDDPATLLAMYDTEARRLAMVQELLREQGTTLFVSVLPGKDFLYPEYLPPQDTMTRTPGPRAYPGFLQAFDRHGVQYVDILGWFLTLRDSVSYPLMYPQGTHWSNIAATYAFDSIMHYMQGLGGPAIRPVQIGTPYKDKVREPDDDLARLLNVIVTPREKEYWYVDVEYPTPALPRQPGLIVIGDSFFWTVTFNYPPDSLFRYAHYWFYNNTIYFDSEHDNVDQVDLRKALADADYVMLNYCSGQLYDLGNGFIVNALLALTTTDEEVQAVRDSLCARIRADEHWLHNLEAKAAREGITIDQAILNDANYLIHTRPEEYFDQLKNEN